MEWNEWNEIQLNGMKNAIMQVTHFLNGPMVNLLFIVILLYIGRK